MHVSEKSIFTRLTVLQPPPREIAQAGRYLQQQKQDTVDEVVRILSRDTISAIVVLKRANNAYYGLQDSINSLTHAVEILGASSVLRILTADHRPSETSIAVRRLVQHGFATAQISHRLVNDEWLWSNNSHVKAGGVFTAGLIHNIGRQAICLTYPEESAMLYGFSDVAFPVEGSLRELEQLQFGADYLEIGAFIGSGYRLPTDLKDVLRYHEYQGTPHPSDSSFELVMTISAAAEMATSLGYGIDGQGSLFHPDSSSGLNWMEERYPGRVERVMSESYHSLVPHDLLKAGIIPAETSKMDMPKPPRSEDRASLPHSAHSFSSMDTVKATN
jgi:HD-like signal output (HDOD) protein